MNFRCPNPECRVKLKAKPEQVGRQFHCPNCRTVVMVPTSDTTQPGVSEAVSAGETGAVGVAETRAGAVSESAPWLPGKILLDDFEVVRPLGRGGMGDVYLVRSRSTREHFAAKRVLSKFLQKERSQELFLGEIRTWIDLPEHPHLTVCRFFRTVGQQTVIFAEYVDGGSLEDRINQGKITTPVQALDIAIQVAWGLAAAHASGLVHQDVKPANVLMTRDGVAKVTDFGLARARTAIEAADGESFDEAAAADALITGAAGTPAYQSPEQARRERLSEKTDVWSWGLSLLAIFCGGRTWSTGTGADRVLEARLKATAGGDAAAFRVGLPEGVADVLRRCFRRDPSDRWGSLLEAADALADGYRGITGRAYPRKRPPHSEGKTTVTVQHDRRTTTGVTWTDPRVWLEEALKTAGRDPSEAARFVKPRSGSRQAQAIDDLIVYEEALSIYTRLVAAGRRDLERDLATVCEEKAFVHNSVGDRPGEIAMYDRVIDIRERLVQQEGRKELVRDLAGAYQNKAIAVGDLGDERAAAALCDKAIEICERQVNQEGQNELAGDLATCYLNKANAVHALGESGAAVALYGKAIEACERLVHQEGRKELAGLLAMAYMNQAVAVGDLGDERAAAALCDKAIEICERQVNQEGQNELAGDLATCYLNKAVAVWALGDNRAAVALYDKAIDIRERQVRQEGRKELAGNLARAYLNKAVAVRNLGDNRAAVALYDKAIEICERQVNQEGQNELAGELANCYLNKANAVNDLGEGRAAVALYDKAIEIRERQVHQEGRNELAGDLAKACLNKASAVRNLGESGAAVALCDKAIEIRERQVHQEGRNELAGDLAKAYLNKAIALEDLEDLPGALRLYGQAAQIQKRLVEKEGRRELAGDLARVQLYWADVARKVGRQDDAAQVARQAVKTLESEARRSGQATLKKTLKWARKNLADLL